MPSDAADAAYYGRMIQSGEHLPNTEPLWMTPMVVPGKRMIWNVVLPDGEYTNEQREWAAKHVREALDAPDIAIVCLPKGTVLENGMPEGWITLPSVSASKASDKEPVFERVEEGQVCFSGSCAFPLPDDWSAAKLSSSLWKVYPNGYQDRSYYYFYLEMPLRYSKVVELFSIYKKRLDEDKAGRRVEQHIATITDRLKDEASDKLLGGDLGIKWPAKVPDPNAYLKDVFARRQLRFEDDTLLNIPDGWEYHVKAERIGLCCPKGKHGVDGFQVMLIIGGTLRRDVEQHIATITAGLKDEAAKAESKPSMDYGAKILDEPLTVYDPKATVVEVQGNRIMFTDGTTLDAPNGWKIVPTDDGDGRIGRGWKIVPLKMVGYDYGYKVFLYRDRGGRADTMRQAIEYDLKNVMDDWNSRNNSHA